MTSNSIRFSKPALLALLLPLALAACQTSQGVSSPSGVGSLFWRSPAPAEPVPRQGPQPGGGPLPSVAELSADPTRFKGLSGPDVTGLLGAPSFQRKDGDAEIWQYYGPASACVLDLFVYPDQGQPRVAHAELRSRGPGNANGCLAAILDGKRG